MSGQAEILSALGRCCVDVLLCDITLIIIPTYAAMLEIKWFPAFAALVIMSVQGAIVVTQEQGNCMPVHSYSMTTFDMKQQGKTGKIWQRKFIQWELQSSRLKFGQILPCVLNALWKL